MFVTRSRLSNTLRTRTVRQNHCVNATFLLICLRSLLEDGWLLVSDERRNTYHNARIRLRMSVHGPGVSISELIRRLETIRDEYGDLPCYSGEIQVSAPLVDVRGPDRVSGRNDETEHVYL